NPTATAKPRLSRSRVKVEVMAQKTNQPSAASLTAEFCQNVGVPYQINLKPNCIWRGSRVRVAWPKLPGITALAISFPAAFTVTLDGFIVVFIPAKRKFVLLNTLKMSHRNCSLTPPRSGKFL